MPTGAGPLGECPLVLAVGEVGITAIVDRGHVVIVQHHVLHTIDDTALNAARTKHIVDGLTA